MADMCAMGQFPPLISVRRQFPPSISVQLYTSHARNTYYATSSVIDVCRKVGFPQVTSALRLLSGITLYRRVHLSQQIQVLICMTIQVEWKQGSMTPAEPFITNWLWTGKRLTGFHLYINLPQVQAAGR